MPSTDQPPAPDVSDQDIPPLTVINAKHLIDATKAYSDPEERDDDIYWRFISYQSWRVH